MIKETIFEISSVSVAGGDGSSSTDLQERMGEWGTVVRCIGVEIKDCPQVPVSHVCQSHCRRTPALSSLSLEERPGSRSSVLLVQSMPKLKVWSSTVSVTFQLAWCWSLVSVSSCFPASSAELFSGSHFGPELGPELGACTWAHMAAAEREHRNQVGN